MCELQVMAQHPYLHLMCGLHAAIACASCMLLLHVRAAEAVFMSSHDVTAADSVFELAQEGALPD